uniref:Uncharacterized protein n=1 Tax=Phaeomonas parva TaxID=124430 RepID=A0A7S1U4D9_9STRA|mmetsp:Transcript_31178/g.99028  ORF Transcript_31178/g.99028 Transcript_31178/m.99028 type:complete len:656 (+) Transcript_31178:320-2287(+)
MRRAILVVAASLLALPALAETPSADDAVQRRKLKSPDIEMAYWYQTTTEKRPVPPGHDIEIAKWLSRMGNHLVQLRHCLTAALYLKVNAYWPGHGEIAADLDGGEHGYINPEKEGGDAGRYYGKMYYDMPVPGLLGAEAILVYADRVSSILRPMLAGASLSRVEDDTLERPDLSIHMRSGDVFREHPHWKYVQPPCYFYDRVMEDFLREMGISLQDALAEDAGERLKDVHVRIIAEDNVNPCVNAFTEKYKFARWQRSPLEEDIAVMLRADRVAYGYGTFAPTLLSGMDAVKKAYLPSHSLEPWGSGIETHVVDIDDYVAIIKDVDGGWKNTAEQRQRMLEWQPAQPRPGQDLRIRKWRRGLEAFLRQLRIATSACLVLGVNLVVPEHNLLRNATYIEVHPSREPSAQQTTAGNDFLEGGAGMDLRLGISPEDEARLRGSGLAELRAGAAQVLARYLNLHSDHDDPAVVADIAVLLDSEYCLLSPRRHSGPHELCARAPAPVSTFVHAVDRAAARATGDAQARAQFVMDTTLENHPHSRHATMRVENVYKTTLVEKASPGVQFIEPSQPSADAAVSLPVKARQAVVGTGALALELVPYMDRLEVIYVPDTVAEEYRRVVGGAAVEVMSIQPYEDDYFKLASLQDRHRLIEASAYP